MQTQTSKSLASIWIAILEEINYDFGEIFHGLSIVIYSANCDEAHR